MSHTATFVKFPGFSQALETWHCWLGVMKSIQSVKNAIFAFLHKIHIGLFSSTSDVTHVAMLCYVICMSSRDHCGLCVCVWCIGSVDSADPVLSSVSQSPLTAAICQPADTLRTHEYSQRDGRSQETQTDVLSESGLVDAWWT